MSTVPIQVEASIRKVEIAFIDTSIAAYRALMEGMREGVEVMLIDAAHDGLAQIAAALAGRGGIDAIHVFAHGAPGVLQLGATRLDEAVLADRAADLAVLRGALADDADLLLYGCDVAADDVGARFLQALSEASGADVAASVDPSGSTLSGGDWELEVRTGNIETGSALTDGGQASFTGVLGIASENFDSLGLINTFGTTMTAGGWTFTSDAATDMAVANSAEFATYLNIDENDPNDRTVALNYDQFIGPLEYRMKSSDGTNFSLGSFRIGQSPESASTLTIVAYSNNALAVPGVTINLANSSSSGNITYSMLANDVNGRYGTLTFGSAYANIDEVRFIFSNPANLFLDNIVVSPAVTDETPPNISSVSVPANDTYAIGETLLFTVTFDENIIVSGTGSSLALDIGGAARNATFQSAPTGTTIVYSYTVQSGDLDANGISINGLSLSASTIRDAAGNPADLTLNNVAATAGVRVDGVAPAITGTITPPPNGTYVAGSNLDFTLTFDENVSITGTSSTLELTIGATPVAATYLSKTANSITYRYVVQAGNLDSDGIAIRGLTLPNGNTIRDAAGNDANLSLAGHLPSLSGVRVDAIAPAVLGNITVPGADSYRAGEVLTFKVSFNENIVVAVGGAPSTLGLTIGGIARSASFLTSDANSVTYTYTVQAGDNDADGIGIDSIALGGMTIRDAAGNNAVLSLTGHLPPTTGILVDTKAPAVSGYVAVPGNGSYGVGQHLDFTVRFDESITIIGTDSTLGLTVGGTLRSASWLFADGNSVTYRYTVQAGDLDADGIALHAIAPGSSTFRDAAGNDANLSLVGHLPATGAVLVDGVAPTIAGMISAPADGWYSVGDELRFTVDFDENIVMSGTGSTLNLNIGGAGRQAVYENSDGNSITYRYVVQSGDNDADGIAITGLALNGSFIRDLAGNNANLALSGHLPSLTGVQVDGGAPSVGAVDVPENAEYRAGDVLSFTVTFDEDVIVAGTDSTLDLTIGATARSASFVSSTGNSITYAYTVQAGDNDADGIAIDALALGATTIRDAAGNDADPALAGRLPSTAGVVIDTTAPAVAGSVTVPLPGTYVAGQSLDFVVSFDENVTVNGGSSTLGLTIGGAARSAAFLSADGNTVSYRYIVQAGDLDANGIEVGAIALGTSTIRDAAGNNAVIALAGHLPSTSAVLVDGTVPAVSGVITVPGNKTYKAGEQLAFTVTFTENVTVTGTASTLGLDIGGAARSAAYDAKTANAITYVYTVQAGDNDADGIGITGLALNGGTLRDAAGNNADLALAGHLPALGAVRVDTAAPVLATARVNGNSMVLSFADAGALDAAHPPAAGDFAVKAAGQSVSVTGVTVDAGTRTVTLTLSSAVGNGQEVTVAYDDLTPNDANAIRDVAGNHAAGFGVTPVVNNTPAPPANPPANPPATRETVDGVTVQVGTVVRSDGSVARVVTVPIVTASRQEQVGDNDVADIPLVKAADGSSLLAVQVPTGAGLQSTGNGAPKRAGDSLTDLIREIRAHTAGGSHDQDQLTGGGGGFLDILDGNTPLLVQTIVLGGNGGAAGKPLGIFSQPQQAGAVQSALVIDARSLASGATLELQHVSFAAIIGAATVTGGAGQQHVWGDGASQTIILGEGDDVLHGGAGDDIVGSASGNDMIYGDEGNDLVFGGEGDDYLDGGAGRDTARFSSAVDGYSLRVRNGLLVTTDRLGSDGVDTVAAVEVLRFTGGQSMADDAVLARLYEGLLGRQASAAELAWWQDAHGRGASLQQIAAAIIDSPEAAQAMGRADDDAFVAGLYRSVLGRVAPVQESAFWTGVLAQGIDRAAVALGFVNSAEKLASSFDIDVNRSDVAVLVRMYHAMFGRAPDEDGLNFWLASHEDGVTLGAIADAFVTSPEARALPGQGSDAAFVDQLYATALGRAPSSGEMALLLDQLRDGLFDRGQVLLNMAESSEHIVLVGAVNTSLDLL